MGKRIGRREVEAAAAAKLQPHGGHRSRVQGCQSSHLLSPDPLSRPYRGGDANQLHVL
jgi:hypothetical protein